MSNEIAMFEYDNEVTKRGVTRYFLDGVLVGKTCGKCGELNPAEEYYSNGSYGDGRKSTCKGCEASYRLSTRDRKNRRMKEYYRENRERIEAYRREWYGMNRDSINQRRRDERALDPQKFLDRQRALALAYSSRSDVEIADDLVRLRPDGLKKCRGCGVSQGVEAFYRNRYAPDGLTSDCAECCKTKATNKRRNAYEEYWLSRGIPFECYMCGGQYEDVEHVWCGDSGGPDVPRNTLPSCVACNRGPGGKHTQMLLTYLWERYGAAEASVILRKVVGWGVWPFDRPYVAEEWLGTV